MKLSPEQTAFIHQLVPPDALITCHVTVVTWIDPATGHNRWTFDYDDETSAASLVGFLELTKQEVIYNDRRPYGEGF